MLTLTTVGYGDMNPYTTAERLTSIVFMIFGVAIYSYTIGSLTTILSQTDSRNRRLKGKLLALDEFALSVDMSPDLYYRVKRIIKYLYYMADIYIYIYIRGNHEMEYYSVMDQNSLMDELPAAMRAELITLIHQKTLQKIKFFKGKNPNFLLEILPALKRISLSKGELIYQEGDWGDESKLLRYIDIYIYI